MVAVSLKKKDSDGDRIVDFVEKPEERPSTLASTACYYFPADQLKLFDEYEQHFKDTDVPKDEYLDEPGRLIEWAHKETDMYAFKFDGEWHDVGTLQGYLDAMRAVTSSNITHGVVKDSDLGENVVVMEGSTVENSKVENSIIFPESEIRNSEIRNSIIDENCEIEDADMNDAIVGEHTTL